MTFFSNLIMVKTRILLSIRSFSSNSKHIIWSNNPLTSSSVTNMGYNPWSNSSFSHIFFFKDFNYFDHFNKSCFSHNFTVSISPCNRFSHGLTHTNVLSRDSINKGCVHHFLLVAPCDRPMLQLINNLWTWWKPSFRTSMTTHLQQKKEKNENLSTCQQTLTKINRPHYN